MMRLWFFVAFICIIGTASAAEYHKGRVVAGDTIDSFSSRYGVLKDDVCRVNSAEVCKGRLIADSYINLPVLSVEESKRIAQEIGKLKDEVGDHLNENDNLKTQLKAAQQDASMNATLASTTIFLVVFIGIAIIILAIAYAVYKKPKVSLPPSGSIKDRQKYSARSSFPDDQGRRTIKK